MGSGAGTRWRAIASLAAMFAVLCAGCTGGTPSSHAARSPVPTVLASPAETALGMRVVQLRSLVGPLVSGLMGDLARGQIHEPSGADVQRAEVGLSQFDRAAASYPKSGPFNSLVTTMVAANRSVLTDVQVLASHVPGDISRTSLSSDLSRWSSASASLARTVGA